MLSNSDTLTHNLALGIIEVDDIEATVMIAIRSPFFFQAEDGIRDHCVTGVQTCALPILLRFIKPMHLINKQNTRLLVNIIILMGFINRCTNRSEERRVGKECRSGWSPNH